MPKIAYLFGAGASEGEFKQRGGLKSILMNDIIQGVMTRINTEEKLELADVPNLLAQDVDIERLITLYEASGIAKDIRAARLLKTLFRLELEERIVELGGDYETGLFAALLDMHLVEGLDEQLIVVMTTNYEDLIEQAMQAVYGSVNYLIKTIPTDAPYVLSNDNVPILKLHGSFNWRNESPVMVENAIGDDQDLLWIPPGVAKKRESYPFDLIWGKARELLDCDVLRVVGSSLSMNDWELVSLVHTTQKLRTDQQPQYTIEIVDYPSTCRRIKDQHKYLNMKTVLEIPEVRDYFVRSYVPASMTSSLTEEKLEELADEFLAQENIFAHWLRAKGEALQTKGVPIDTDSGYFKQFVLAGL